MASGKILLPQSMAPTDPEFEAVDSEEIGTRNRRLRLVCRGVEGVDWLTLSIDKSMDCNEYFCENCRGNDLNGPSQMRCELW